LRSAGTLAARQLRKRDNSLAGRYAGRLNKFAQSHKEYADNVRCNPFLAFALGCIVLDQNIPNLTRLFGYRPAPHFTVRYPAFLVRYSPSPSPRRPRTGRR
jgi:hypothetical protein